MKKITILFSAIFLFASLTFAQTPQKPEKAAPPSGKKEVKHDPASGCDKKTKEACSKTKDPKGCCSKAKSSKKAPETTPPVK